MSDFSDVGDFHHKFDLHSVFHDGQGPQPFDRELLEFRMKFMLEELTEFVEGAGYEFTIVPFEDQPIHIDVAEGMPDHAKMFDALIDLVYVAMGTAHLFGYPWWAGWAEVQDANMAKVRAAKDGSDSVRGSSFDVVKPPGWTAPDIAGLLSELGWDIDNTKDSN